MATAKQIAKAMPDGQCLDSDEDARRLARWFCSKYENDEGRAFSVGRVYKALYGNPWCTDNDEERLKIARILARF